MTDLKKYSVDLVRVDIDTRMHFYFDMWQYSIEGVQEQLAFMMQGVNYIATIDECDLEDM